MKTLFIEARSGKDLVPAIRKNLAKLKSFKRLGLFTTVQHIGKIKDAEKFLQSHGLEVVTKSSQKSADVQGIKAKYCGQLLGCDSTAAKSMDSGGAKRGRKTGAQARQMNVSAFLYIGTGEFHPLAISLETDKPVLKLNPFTKHLEQISEQEKRKWLARQAARLDKLERAKKVGIILSTKPGQYKPQLARKLQKKFAGSYLFISDTITPQALMDFPDIDCWINTACPRLVEDKWSKTFVNADEVL